MLFNFQHRKLYSFLNLNLGRVILEIFITFREFKPRLFFENINSYKKDVLIVFFVFHIRNIGGFQVIRQKWRWADFCGGARRSYEASWTDGVR